MRLLAIIITYYPEKELLEKNVSAIIADVDKILIWENTPGKKKHLYRYVEGTKIEYVGDGTNSISHALNYAWKYAKATGFDYLLTMDQDSVFLNFPYYLKSTVFNDNCPQGIWTPICVLNDNDVLSKDATGINEVSCGVTSGMLQSVLFIETVGGWNEAFSIDGVDLEYCFRAKRKGIRTYKVESAHLLHHLGTPKEYRFLRYHVTLSNYSPQRYHDIYMSHIILWRMFPEQQAFNTFSKKFWYSNIKWIGFFEEKGIIKLFFILKGMIKGYLCKTPVLE